jgi:hypothetical protein
VSVRVTVACHQRSGVGITASSSSAEFASAAERQTEGAADPERHSCGGHRIRGTYARYTTTWDSTPAVRRWSRDRGYAAYFGTTHICPKQCGTLPEGRSFQAKRDACRRPIVEV